MQKLYPLVLLTLLSLLALPLGATAGSPSDCDPASAAGIPADSAPNLDTLMEAPASTCVEHKKCSQNWECPGGACVKFGSDPTGFCLC